MTRKARSRPYLTLAAVEASLGEARARGVSPVARSPRGFVTAYRRAKGRPERLSEAWRARRDAFVARHMAQVRARNEPLWKDGAPTRRHLALVMWAMSPTPARLARWLRG